MTTSTEARNRALMAAADSVAPGGTWAAIDTRWSDPQLRVRRHRNMRWITYGPQFRAGLVVGELVHGLDVPLIELVHDLPAAGERAREAPVETVPLDAVRLHAPIPQPPSVRDFLSFEERSW